jgi:predicted nucleic acid-binding protein
VSLVLDASAVTAALIDTGSDGRWAEELLTTEGLVAPHLMPIEVANILRRAALVGDLSADAAGLAHADLLVLPGALFPYASLGERVWALRENLTASDACYVALAELLEAPLATLDNRLARASGPQCEFVTPDTGSF